MTAVWEALAATPLAEAMRLSRWGYAAASGLHVLGIALLVGAILGLDLRLIGAWASVPLAAAARIAVPVAATGLGLASLTGACLFLADPVGYAAEPVLQAKLGLVALGAAHALAFHAGPGLSGASPARLRAQGIVSALIWLGALGLGRAIAFVAA